MKVSSAVAGGLAGTLTVASLHEAFRRVRSDAPRMDLLDMDLIRKGLKNMKKDVPADSELQRWAVGGELFCDTAYYGLISMGGKKGVWTRGLVAGLIAGVAAVILPKQLGLPPEPSNRTVGTQIMTVGLYVMGGLVAAAIASLVESTQSDNKEEDEDRLLSKTS